MRQFLDKVRLAIKLAPTKVYDFLFEMACKLLLPLSTMCKVCNMLRGMGIGVVIGCVSTAAAFLLKG
jgi:hypothetical protein